MENELFFTARQLPSPTAFESTSAMSVWQQLAPAPNCSLEKSTGYFLNPSTHFDSPHCAVVPSPEVSNSDVSAEGIRIRELIGTLGKNPRYSATLSSHPKLNSPLLVANSNVAEFSGDPGFAERARFSCFGSKSFSGRTGQFPSHGSTPLMADGKLSRVSSSPSLKAFGSTHPLESTFSEQISNDLNCRKRKANSKGKSKELVKESEINEHLNGKRCKVDENNMYGNAGDRTEAEGDHGKRWANEEKTNMTKSKSNPKPPEPYKDYIHVRARRGQATDSHSLAERVRREKISERMKLLQDLVPGCNKVTGKALMLDEIINYVQSLQRQVEFLSMKLASVNTRLESTVDSPISKEAFQSSNSLSNPVFPNDSSPSTIYGHHNLGLQLPLMNGIDPQVPRVAPMFQAFEEDSLQSIVQMGIGQSQNRETAFQCPFAVSGMEIEL